MMDATTLNVTRWLSDLSAMILTQQFGMDCPDAVIDLTLSGHFIAEFEDAGIQVRSFTDRESVTNPGYCIRTIGLNGCYHSETATRYASHLAQAARLCERFNRANGRIPTIPAHVDIIQERGSHLCLSANRFYLGWICPGDCGYDATYAEFLSDWEPKTVGNMTHIRKETRS